MSLRAHGLGIGRILGSSSCKNAKKESHINQCHYPESIGDVGDHLPLSVEWEVCQVTIGTDAAQCLPHVAHCSVGSDGAVGQHTRRLR